MDRIFSKESGISEITNREDLINALTIASQLEQGLMLMYLYAAYSIKASAHEFEGTTDERETRRFKARNWEGIILRVARQEMEHLGFVCNMLSVIGGPQYFERPNFPQAAQFWQVDLPIELERFNAASLQRFMLYEKPANLIDPLFESVTSQELLAAAPPQDPEYRSIAELYRMIRDAFATIPEKTLFIVPPTAQVDNDALFGSGSNVRPTHDLTLFKTWDRVSAINAVDEIIEHGEGTKATRSIKIEELDPKCHYMQFRRIYLEYVLGIDPDQPVPNMPDIRERTPLFESARPCVKNPSLQLHQDTITRPTYHGQGNQPERSVAIVNHPYTTQIMGVANASYETLIQMLIRLYTSADDTPNERNGILQMAFFPYMTLVIRPLSELLSQLPAFAPNPRRLTAGIGFEYSRTIGFLPHKPAAWIYLHERLETTAKAFAAASTNLLSDEERKCLGPNFESSVEFIGHNLQRIADDFKTYMGL